MNRSGRFIGALLWQLVPCEDKKEAGDIIASNLGPDPNFAIKLHLREERKGMTPLCVCTHVCDPGDLPVLQTTGSHRAAPCPEGLGVSGGSRIHTSHWDVSQSRVSPMRDMALGCQHGPPPPWHRGWQAKPKGQGWRGPWRIDSFLPAR